MLGMSGVITGILLLNLSFLKCQRSLMFLLIALFGALDSSKQVSLLKLKTTTQCRGVLITYLWFYGYICCYFVAIERERE